MACRIVIVLALGFVLVAMVLVSTMGARSDSSSSLPQFAPNPQLGRTPSSTDEPADNQSAKAEPIGGGAEELSSEAGIGNNGKGGKQGHEIEGTIESRALQGNAISSDFVANAGPDGERFYELVDEFMNLANPYGLAQKQKYRQFFQEKSALTDEVISLELLECGAILCVAELRSAEAGELRNFMDERAVWEGFDSRVKLEFRSDEDTTARVVFSHDPNVIGITLPSALNHQSLGK